VNNITILVAAIIIIFQSCQSTQYQEQLVFDFDKKLCKNEGMSFKDCYLALINNNDSKDEFKICLSELDAINYVNNELKNNSKYWIGMKGFTKETYDTKVQDQEFVTFSKEYLDWLTDYSKRIDGKWIHKYLNKYYVTKDISPSMIIDFDNLIRNQNLDDKNVRIIFLMHYLTLSFNSCQ
jgi:hypothetical protein